MSGHNSRTCPRQKAIAQSFATMSATDRPFVFEGEGVAGPSIHDEADITTSII